MGERSDAKVMDISEAATYGAKGMTETARMTRYSKLMSLLVMGRFVYGYYEFQRLQEANIIL